MYLQSAILAVQLNRCWVYDAQTLQRRCPGLHHSLGSTFHSFVLVCICLLLLPPLLTFLSSFSSFFPIPSPLVRQWHWAKVGQSVGGQWGRRDSETAGQGGSESAYFAVAAPSPPARTSGTPGPSGALRRLGDPLLDCHHYFSALCNICLHSSLPFPSSLISLTPPPPSSSFGFLLPRCPATATRVHHHRGASWGRNA